MNQKLLSFAGPVLVLFAAAMWGTVGIFTKQLYSYGFSPIQISFFRVFVSTIIIFPYMFIRHPKDMKIRSKKDLLFFLVSGTFGLALTYTTYFMTIQVSTLSIAAVMLYSAPIIVTILAAILFKEKLTITKLLSIVLSFTGCIVMSGILGGAVVTLSFVGILIGFTSGLGYALYSIGSRYALKVYSTYAVSAYTFAFATIGLLPFINIKATANLLVANPPAVLAILEMGIMCTLVPFTIYVIALTYVEVSKASIISIIEPVVATLVGVIMFNEVVTSNVIISIAIILASVVVANVDFKRKSETEEYKIKGTRSAQISVGRQAERLFSERYSKRNEKKIEVEQAFVEANHKEQPKDGR